MVKAEWGAKHGCPKCGTRFSDLGKDDPIVCIQGDRVTHLVFPVTRASTG